MTPDITCAIAPSFGAILLTDINAPRCFEIEQKLRARLSMPVLHEDQHVTAIVVVLAMALGGYQLYNRVIRPALHDPATTPVQSTKMK